MMTAGKTLLRASTGAGWTGKESRRGSGVAEEGSRALVFNLRRSWCSSLPLRLSGVRAQGRFGPPMLRHGQLLPPPGLVPGCDIYILTESESNRSSLSGYKYMANRERGTERHHIIRGQSTTKKSEKIRLMTPMN